MEPEHTVPVTGLAQSLRHFGRAGCVRAARIVPCGRRARRRRRRPVVPRGQVRRPEIYPTRESRLQLSTASRDEHGPRRPPRGRGEHGNTVRVLNVPWYAIL